MIGNLLLDTNIFIAIFNKEPVVLQYVYQTKNLFVPSIVLGELYYGALNSRQVKENLTSISNIAINSIILLCDNHTANVRLIRTHQIHSLVLHSPHLSRLRQPVLFLILQDSPLGGVIENPVRLIRVELKLT